MFNTYTLTIFHQEWNDDRLTWDADQYEHIKTIIVEYHEIWHPDFIAYNK